MGSAFRISLRDRCSVLQAQLQQATYLLHWQSTSLQQQQDFIMYMSALIMYQQSQLELLQTSLTRTILATSLLVAKQAPDEDNHKEDLCGGED